MHVCCAYVSRYVGCMLGMCNVCASMCTRIVGYVWPPVTLTQCILSIDMTCAYSLSVILSYNDI